MQRARAHLTDGRLGRTAACKHECCTSLNPNFKMLLSFFRKAHAPCRLPSWKPSPHSRPGPPRWRSPPRNHSRLYLSIGMCRSGRSRSLLRLDSPPTPTAQKGALGCRRCSREPTEQMTNGHRIGRFSNNLVYSGEKGTPRLWPLPCSALRPHGLPSSTGGGLGGAGGREALRFLLGSKKEGRPPSCPGEFSLRVNNHMPGRRVLPSSSAPGRAPSTASKALWRPGRQPHRQLPAPRHQPRLAEPLQPQDGPDTSKTVPGTPCLLGPPSTLRASWDCPSHPGPLPTRSALGAISDSSGPSQTVAYRPENNGVKPPRSETTAGTLSWNQ